MGQLKLVWDRQEPKNVKRAVKLTTDKFKLLKLLENGQCWLVSALAKEIGNRCHSSVSANVRNLRKDGYIIKLIRLGNGLNGYELKGKK